MKRGLPESKRMYSPVPYTTLCRSVDDHCDAGGARPPDEVGALREPLGREEGVPGEVQGCGARELRVGQLIRAERTVGPAHREERALLAVDDRSEEHTSELQSLMRSSYAVCCLKKKTPNLYKP